MILAHPVALQVWLEYGVNKQSSPEQLPIVLQVLLSQVDLCTSSLFRVSLISSVLGSSTTSPRATCSFFRSWSMGCRLFSFCWYFSICAKIIAKHFERTTFMACFHLGEGKVTCFRLLFLSSLIQNESEIACAIKL